MAKAAVIENTMRLSRRFVLAAIIIFSMFSRDTFSAAQLNQASLFGLHFTSLWRIVNAQVQIRTDAYASRLERRLIQIEKLDAQAKRQIARIRDTFIEREKLKQCVRAQETATS